MKTVYSLVIVILLASILGQVCPAQMLGQYYKGGYISNEGDTVFGKIRLQTQVDYYIMKIGFIDLNGNKRTLSGGDLRWFWISFHPYLDKNDEVTYIYESYPKPENPDKVIMLKLIVDGPVIKLFEGRHITVTTTNWKDWSLDLHSDYSFENGKIVKDNGGLKLNFGNDTKEVPTSFVIVKEGLPATIIRKGNFDELFDRYFADSPQLMQYLNENQDAKKFRNISFLVQYYNQFQNEKK